MIFEFFILYPFKMIISYMIYVTELAWPCYIVSLSILKLVNYSYCYQPTRTPNSGQVDESRNAMKNELKTTRV